MNSLDLRHALNTSTAWIHRHIEDFSFAIDESADRQLLLLKPFSELVLAMHVLKQCDDDTLAKNHLDWAWKKVDRGDFFFRLLLARPDFYQLTLPIAYFSLNGFRNERLLHLIDKLRELRAFMKFECERWVNISVLYALELLGFRRLSISDFEGCWLFERPEPWLVTTSSIYSLTHEVFYLTDFGNSHRKAPPDLTSYINCWGPAWISHYIEKEDWDIIGELVVVARCLDLKWAINAVRLLIDAQDRDGSIAGPPRAGLPLIHSSDSVERKEFLSRYHTTLVATIAFAMCLQYNERGGGARQPHPPALS